MKKQTTFEISAELLTFKTVGWYRLGKSKSNATKFGICYKPSFKRKHGVCVGQCRISVEFVSNSAEVV